MPIVNPRPLHKDKYLTNLSIEVPQEGFLAEAIAPAFKVDHITDTYLDWTAASTHRLYDNQIAQGEDPKYIEYDAQEHAFRCIPYALADLVNVDDIKNADAIINLMGESARFLENAMRLAREARVLSAAFNPALVPGIPAGGAWSGAGGTPIRNARAAIIQIQRRTQTTPNSIAMSREKAIELLGTNEWLAYFAGTAPGYEKGLWAAKAGFRMLGLELYIGGVCALETEQGTPSDPDVWGRLMGDGVIVYTRKPKPTKRTRCFMYSPAFVTREVGKEYITRKRSWEIISYERMDELMIDANCGCRITGA